MWKLEVILCLKCSLACLVFSQTKRKQKKLLTKTHDGRISVAQAGKPKEQYKTIVHTWTARHVLSFMFPFLWELFCGKDHKTKKAIARNLKAWSHYLFEVFINMIRIFSK